MTIGRNVQVYETFEGDDNSDRFPINFKVFEAEDIEALIIRDSDGVSFEMSQPEHYSVSANKKELVLKPTLATWNGTSWVGTFPEWQNGDGTLKDGYSIHFHHSVEAYNLSKGRIPSSVEGALDLHALQLKAIVHKLSRAISYSEATVIKGKPHAPLSGDEILARIIALEGGGESKYDDHNWQGFSGTLGKSINTTGVIEAITELYDFQTFDPTLSLSFLGIGAGPFEKGVDQTVSDIRAAVTQGTALMTSLVINAVTGAGAADIPDGPWNFTAPADFNPEGTSNIDTGDGPWNISDTVTVSGTVTDADGKTGNASRTITFVYPRFFGKTNSPASEAQIKALTKSVVGSRALSAAAPAGVNFIYYVYPASYGNLNSITHSAAPSTNTLAGNWTKTVENFTMADGATVPYNVYVTNTVSTTTTGTFTFS